MSSSSHATELCQTCLYLPDCTRRLECDFTITSCDRYVADPSRVGDMNIDGVPELKGLCKYCIKRHNCSIYKPKGGIWHCEEYQ